MNGIIQKRRTNSEISSYIPLTSDVRIDEFFVGIVQKSSSYQSDGSTRYFNYNHNHFGMSVTNSGQKDVFVKLIISELDREGYSTGERIIRDRIYGGQKKRLWDYKGFEKHRGFGNQLIKEISIENSERELFETKPNVTILRAMDYTVKKPKDRKFLRLTIRYLLIAIVAYFSIKYVFSPLLKALGILF